MGFPNTILTLPTILNQEGCHLPNLLDSAAGRRLVTKRGDQPFTARDRGEMRIRTSLRPGLANSSQSHQEGSKVQVRLSQAIWGIMAVLTSEVLGRGLTLPTQVLVISD
jgi:hypothetical protein